MTNRFMFSLKSIVNKSMYLYFPQITSFLPHGIFSVAHLVVYNYSSEYQFQKKKNMSGTLTIMSEVSFEGILSYQSQT